MRRRAYLWAFVIAAFTSWSLKGMAMSVRWDPGVSKPVETLSPRRSARWGSAEGRRDDGPAVRLPGPAGARERVDRGAPERSLRQPVAHLPR